MTYDELRATRYALKRKLCEEKQFASAAQLSVPLPDDRATQMKYI